MRDFPIAAITRFYFFFLTRIFDLLSPFPFFLSSLRYALDLLYAQLWLNATRLRAVSPVVSSCTSQNSPLGSDRRDHMYAAPKKTKKKQKSRCNKLI